MTAFFNSNSYQDEVSVKLFQASLLMEDATVGAGCTVHSSILGVGVTVGGGAVLTRCVIGDGAAVQSGEHLVDVRRAA